MNTEADRAASRSLAHALAQRFSGWSVEQHPKDWDHATFFDLVRSPDGARIRVSVGGWRNEGRVKLSGQWPDYRDGSHYWPKKPSSITCDATRSPDVIAGEIRRRLLPQYERDFAEARADVTLTGDRQEETMLVAKRLVAISGGSVERSNQRYRDCAHMRISLDTVGQARVHPAYGAVDSDMGAPARVDMNLSNVDPSDAAEILAILRAAQDRENPARARIGEPAVNEEPEEEQEQPELRRVAT